MTLRLAGFQHFCARFTDALLTSWNPLTYEHGDYQDLTEAADPDYEPETCGKHTGRCSNRCLRAAGHPGDVHDDDPPTCGCFGPYTYGCPVHDAENFAAVDAQARSASPSPSHIASPVCGEGPSGACDIPPSPPLGFQLPMYDAGDISAEIELPLIGCLKYHRFRWVNHSSIGPESHCGCGFRPRDLAAWEEHVTPLLAEVAVSAMTYELQSICFDQTQQK
jgi:hypothetical protein